MAFLLAVTGSLLIALLPSESFLLQPVQHRVFNHAEESSSFHRCLPARKINIHSPFRPSVIENVQFSQYEETTRTRLFLKRKYKGYDRTFKEKPMCDKLETEINDVPVGQLDPEVLKFFHPVMDVWAKRRSRNGAMMAEKLMKRLSDEVEAGNTNARITTKICNTVIDAWAKSGEIGCAENATKTLVWMDQMHKEKNYDTLPDTISFTQIIDAHAKSNEEKSAEKAESILALMEKMNVSPNTITFNSVLNAWSRSKDMDKAVRVEELVRRMRALHEAGNSNVKPDVYSYQQCIYAWSRSKVWGAPQRCEEILQMMDAVSKETGNEGMKPNSFCFTAAINAWSKSRERRKARNAYKILQYMDRLYTEGNDEVKPNVIAYTAVLNACGFPPPNDDEEKRESFDIAFLTFEELRMSDYDSPNHVTYAAFLNVCARTLPIGTKERERMVRRTFQLCCQDGQVSSVVLEKLRLAASEDLYKELVGNAGGSNNNSANNESPDGTIGNLPLDWTCNVRGERKWRAKRVYPSEKKVAAPSLAKLNVVKKARGTNGQYSKDKVKYIDFYRKTADIAKEEEKKEKPELGWKQKNGELEEIHIQV